MMIDPFCVEFAFNGIIAHDLGEFVNKIGIFFIGKKDG